MNEWHITFSCGHTAHWPDDWNVRAAAQPDHKARYASTNRKYWLDQSRPWAAGSVAACPLCRGRQPRRVATQEAG